MVVGRAAIHRGCGGARLCLRRQRCASDNYDQQSFVHFASSLRHAPPAHLYPVYRLIWTPRRDATIVIATIINNMGFTANHPPRPAIVTVLGPTGSGKSVLALDLAEGFSGEIVNCDSLQLYRGFDIGTAKTPPNQRRGVPHHLFDVLEPQMGYSAGEYSRQARSVVAQITARGRLPVIVGGTGFYLRALLAGLPALPGRDEELRSRLLGKEQARPGRLHRFLTRLEPAAAARIHPRDVQKATRALEVRLLTGSSLPAPAQAQPLEGYVNVKIGLNPDRAVLHQRLDARALAMFRGGLLEEV